MDLSVSISSTEKIKSLDLPKKFANVKEFKNCLIENIKKSGLPIKTKNDGVVISTTELGRGSFGTVMKGSYNNQDIAMKFLNDLDYSIDPDISIKNIIGEIYAIVKVDAPNIPKFHGIVISDDETIGMMFDCIDGETLFDYCSCDDPKLDFFPEPDERPSRKTIIEKVIQLIKIIQSLHAKNVIHRDIKPKNVMVTKKEEKVILVDFGIARINENAMGTTNTKKFTPLYCPPEAVTDVGSSVMAFNVTTKFDIWSLGCTILHVVTGKPPWDRYSDAVKIGYSLKDKDISHLFPRDFKENEPELWEVLELCFEIDPKDRYTCEELLDSVTQYYNTLKDE